MGSHWGGGDSTDSECTKYLRGIVSGNRRSKERRDWLKQQRDMQKRQKLFTANILKIGHPGPQELPSQAVPDPAEVLPQSQQHGEG